MRPNAPNRATGPFRYLKFVAASAVLTWMLAGAVGHAEAGPLKLYWGEGNGISRATGSYNSPKIKRLIVKGVKPEDVAVNGSHIYWAEEVGDEKSRIGSARLNGSHVHRNLITGLKVVRSLDANNKYIFWINRDRSGQRFKSTLGRAKANGRAVRRNLRRFSYSKSAAGTTVSQNAVFWSELRRRHGTTYYYFMKAGLGGNKPQTVSKLVPTGVLFATSPPYPTYSFNHLYWVDIDATYTSHGFVEEPAMFRTQVAGGGQFYEENFGNIHFKQNYANPAVDSKFIYWKQRSGWISRMNLKTRKRVMRYIRTGHRGYDLEVPLTK